MIKTILVSLTGSPSDTAVLETAVLAASKFSAHVDCLHVTLGRVADEAATELEASVLFGRTAEQLRMMQRRVMDAAEKARASFDEICTRRHLRLSNEPLTDSKASSYSYQEVVGSDLHETIRAARMRELVIVARDSRNVVVEPDRAATIMLSSGRPLLVPPRKASKSLGSRVAIAWKDSDAAARAIAAAMPFISSGATVSVLTASENGRDIEALASSAEGLVQQLKWSAGSAARKVLEFSPKPTSETLLDEAYRIDADLLVMGGYGHSRLREFVLGGVTRDVLEECEIPVLLSH